MKKGPRGRKKTRAAFYGFQFDWQNKNQTKQTCNLPLGLSDKLALITSESRCLEGRNRLDVFPASVRPTVCAPASAVAPFRTVHDGVQSQGHVNPNPAGAAEAAGVASATPPYLAQQRLTSLL